MLTRAKAAFAATGAVLLIAAAAAPSDAATITAVRYSSGTGVTQVAATSGLYGRPSRDAHLVTTHLSRYPGNLTIRIDAVHVDPAIAGVHGGWNREFGTDIRITQGRRFLMGGAINSVDNQGRPQFMVQCFNPSKSNTSFFVEDAPTAVSYSSSYFLIKVPLTDFAACGFQSGAISVSTDAQLFVGRVSSGQLQQGNWISTENGLTTTY